MELLKKFRSQGRSARLTAALGRFRQRVRRFLTVPSPRADNPLHLPEIHVYEGPGEIRVQVDTQDMDPREIEIHLVGNALQLVGKSEEVTASADTKRVRIHSAARSFKRSLVLPEGIDKHGVRAKTHGHVLSIVIPRMPKAAAPAGLDTSEKL
jgi:HSP20 family molecular chaperone IbpA